MISQITNIYEETCIFDFSIFFAQKFNHDLKLSDLLWFSFSFIFEKEKNIDN